MPACFSEQGGSHRRGGASALQINGEITMTYLTKKITTEILHGKSKAFTMKLGDLPNMVDAVFDGHHKMPGWVHMFANAKGCDHVDGLFPEAHIEWRELPPGLPNDWRGMQVNLPEAVSATTTHLPLEVIPAGRTIDDCSPDQFALLLAFGVRRDGGRAAILRQNNGAVSVELFIPREN
jgi:urease gamma subunit